MSRIVIHVVCDEGDDTDRAIQAACLKAHRELPNSGFIAFSQSASSFEQEQAQQARVELLERLLREAYGYTTALSDFLPDRIASALRTAPNRKADPAAVVGGSASSELLDSDRSNGEKP